MWSFPRGLGSRAEWHLEAATVSMAAGSCARGWGQASLRAQREGEAVGRRPPPWGKESPQGLNQGPPPPSAQEQPVQPAPFRPSEESILAPQPPALFPSSFHHPPAPHPISESTNMQRLWLGPGDTGGMSLLPSETALSCESTLLAWTVIQEAPSAPPLQGQVASHPGCPVGQMPMGRDQG